MTTDHIPGPGSLFYRTDDSTLVYTYTSSLVPILKSGHLRASSFDNLNDPRESKAWIYEDSEQGLMFTDEELVDSRISPEPKYIRGQARLLCFTEDRLIIGGEKSWLHKGWARPRMWHQYGVERRTIKIGGGGKVETLKPHGGACLVFNRDAILASLPTGLSWHHGSVVYRDHIISRDDISAAAQSRAIQQGIMSGPTVSERIFDDQVRRLFFTKTPDWASENEWRVCGLYPIVSYGKHATTWVEVDITDSLRFIVIGEKFAANQTMQEFLIDQSRRYGASLFRCTWNNGTPRLVRAFE